MNRPAASDSWANALLPFPSVYDRPGEDAQMTKSPGPALAVCRHPDGSIDYEHYGREAGRLHRAAVARAIRLVLSATRRGRGPSPP